MKKTILLVLLLVAGVSAYAQKSYINMSVRNIENSTSNCVLTGDVPEGINHNPSGGVGSILNLLAEYGYEVECMSMSVTTINYNTAVTFANYVLSKNESEPEPYDPGIITLQKEIGDTEAYEVARYNLQGIPVNKDEKGIQIVVYSNYTTKTVIVE